MQIFIFNGCRSFSGASILQKIVQYLLALLAPGITLHPKRASTEK